MNKQNVMMGIGLMVVIVLALLATDYVQDQMAARKMKAAANAAAAAAASIQGNPDTD